MNSTSKMPIARKPSLALSLPATATVTGFFALSGLALFAGTASAQCLSMEYLPTATTVGTAVSDMISGDIDHDGDLDVLIADGNAGTIRVLVNNGSLGFAAHTLNAGAPPSVLVLGDLDSDGDLDLIVGFNGGVSWLRNAGTGNFTLADTFSFPAGDSNPVNVRLADVNEDGHLDVVVGLRSHPVPPGTSGGLAVALGDGAGHLQWLPTQNLLLQTSNMELADFNGDGHLDVAYLGGSLFPSAVAIASGHGDGTFANNSSTISTGIYSNGLAIGDFDGDGDVDLASGFKYGMKIFLNNGTGGLTVAQTVAVGSYVKGITAGDIDGDGDIDLLATSGSLSAIRLVTNDSTGHFSVTATVPASIQCYSVMLADTSGDGYLDAWAGDVTSGQLFTGVSHCLSTCGGSANYCIGAPNSTGLGAAISYTGSRSILANTFTLGCTHLPPNSIGEFYFGAAQTSVPFGNGLRCVTGSVVRLRPTLTAGTAGNVSRWVDVTSPPAQGVLMPGSTHYFQYWYRNPAGGGAGFNLSDGLSVTFCN